MSGASQPQANYTNNSPLFFNSIGVKVGNMENRLNRRDEKNAKEIEHQTANDSDFLCRKLIFHYVMCITRTKGGRIYRN